MKKLFAAFEYFYFYFYGFVNENVKVFFAANKSFLDFVTI